MRVAFASVVVITFITFGGKVIAQLPVIEIGTDTMERSVNFDAADLHGSEVALPGSALQMPGLNLSLEARSLLLYGDSATLADRAFDDQNWPKASHVQDSVVPGGRVLWLRYHFDAAPDLKGVPLLLSIGALVPCDVFLNGRSVVRLPEMHYDLSAAELPSADSIPRVQVPVMFACDGRPEVLAVRFILPTDMSLIDTGIRASLHRFDAYYQLHRRLTHFGLFIGVNLMIVLLALVIWWYDRRERSWSLLALLSFVTALDTFTELASEVGALGFVDPALHVLGSIKILLTPWPLYFLIMALERLHGDLDTKRSRRYTRAVIVVTALCLAFVIGMHLGLVDGSEGISTPYDSLVIILALVLGGLLFAAVLVWFSVAAIRLGIKLMRAKGFERWVGGGAVASMLLVIVLKIASGVTGMGLSAWLQLIADYCSYVAVPISVAVYLAIRSAHHNRLVARQRDDLDAEVKERTAELRAERDRSDELLLNILPADVADELKRTGEAVARNFDQATVLFTDFKGFTSMSATLPPQELLHELNTCFKAFDDIITARGIEKIKTIGDAYMCAGGLPDPKTSSPADVVLAALEMQAFMTGRKNARSAQGPPAFEMRVGIHTGPVVAGIVGVKKFQYDIWGDTVNTASRMESSGEVGQVNISGATYTLVKDATTPLGGRHFTFTQRGKVQAKGKGEMEMYFVHDAMPTDVHAED